MAEQRWRVNATTMGKWEVGYCRLGTLPSWLRIWIRGPEASAECHVFGNGKISFTTEAGGASREVYDALLAAVDQANEHDPGVYCHGCSEAGGADQPIYHLPPVCSAPAAGAGTEGE